MPSRAVRQRLQIEVDFPLELAAFPRKEGLAELLLVAAGAASFWPPLLLQSLLGPVRSWLGPHPELSEFTIIDWKRAASTLQYLTSVVIPSLRRQPPELLQRFVPPLLLETLFRQTRVYDHVAAGENPFPRERWFFINGIATNRAVADLNARLLFRLFGRPVTVIQNTTNSVAVDLVECAVGKEFKSDPDLDDRGTFTEPALIAANSVLEAVNLDAVDKVVVIAHSQGTIIVANALRAISKALRKREMQSAARRSSSRLAALARQVVDELTVDAPTRSDRSRRRLVANLTVFLEQPAAPLAKLAKLEVYTFANCADRMKHVATVGDRKLPYLEHFANQRDVVARLGVLSPCTRWPKLIDIDGPLFLNRGSGWLKRGAWGHLLNEHYLLRIERYLRESSRGRWAANPYPGDDVGMGDPRLYAYFGGSG